MAAWGASPQTEGTKRTASQILEQHQRAGTAAKLEIKSKSSEKILPCFQPDLLGALCVTFVPFVVSLYLRPAMTPYKIFVALLP
jgi:hypothetical protein